MVEEIVTEDGWVCPKCGKRLKIMGSHNLRCRGVPYVASVEPVAPRPVASNETGLIKREEFVKKPESSEPSVQDRLNAIRPSTAQDRLNALKTQEAEIMAELEKEEKERQRREAEELQIKERARIDKAQAEQAVTLKSQVMKDAPTNVDELFALRSRIKELEEASLRQRIAELEAQAKTKVVDDSDDIRYYEAKEQERLTKLKQRDRIIEPPRETAPSAPTPRPALDTKVCNQCGNKVITDLVSCPKCEGQDFSYKKKIEPAVILKPEPDPFIVKAKSPNNQLLPQKKKPTIDFHNYSQKILLALTVGCFVGGGYIIKKYPIYLDVGVYLIFLGLITYIMRQNWNTEYFIKRDFATQSQIQDALYDHLRDLVK